MKILKKVAKLVFATSCILLSAVCYSQNQKRADSLINVLSENNLSDSIRLALLWDLASSSSAPKDIMQYSDELLQLSESLGEMKFVVLAYELQGVALRLKGDLKAALEKQFLGARIAIDNELYENGITLYLEIASTYSTNQDFKNSLLYEKKAIELTRQYGDQRQLGINLLNTGFSYYNLNHLDSALLLFNEAEPIFKEINLEIGTAYVIGNRALVYWKKGKKQQAISSLLEAINILEPLGDQFGMADYHNQLGQIYLEENKLEESIYHTDLAMKMANDLGLKEQIRDGAKLLSQLYNKQKKHQEALKYLGLYIVFKDSIENSEQTKLMADMRTEFEVDLREKEIETLEKDKLIQRNYIVIVIILLVLSVVGTLYFKQRLSNTRLLAEKDQKRNEEKITKLLSDQESKALQSIIKGREEERQRLAKELHNHLGSLFATVKVNLNGLETKESSQFHTINMLVDQACTDIRNISHSLNMGVSENFGLIPALRELTDHLKKSGGMDIEFSASMNESEMSSQQEILIYRIVQELVSNVLKHAQANKLSVLLTYFEKDRLINILVQDNGVGFDSTIISEKADGMGINTLINMVENTNGEITFDSNPQSGTTVNIDLPLDEV